MLHRQELPATAGLAGQGQFRRVSENLSKIIFPYTYDVLFTRIGKPAFDRSRPAPSLFDAEFRHSRWDFLMLNDLLLHFHG